VTLLTTTSVPRVLHVVAAIHLNPATANAPPKADKRNARPALAATDKEKSDCKGGNL